MAVEMNGYSNPNRSDHLNAALNAFKDNPKKTWEGKHPTFHQTVQKMQIVGKILLGLSGAFAIIAITVPITSLTQLNHQLIVGGIFGGSAVILGIVGVIVLTKTYWDDPAYRQKKREEIIEHLILQGYNATNTKYGEINQKHQLVSENEICHIIHTHYQMDQKNYSELNNEIRNSAYITSEMKSRAFLRDVENKSVLEIFRIYGLILIKENRTVIQEKLSNELKDVTVHDILRTYDFNLLIGLEDSINKKLQKETENVSWEEIYTIYNINNKFWDLFSCGILQGLFFRKKAQSELEKHDLVYMVRKYSSNIFKHHVLDPHALKPADFREIFSKVTFVEFFNKFCPGLPLPFLWNQQAVALAQEYQNATTKHLEPIDERDEDGTQRLKMIFPQDSATLVKTVDNLNQRWNEFLSQQRDNA
jgi:hypothetical protein